MDMTELFCTMPDSYRLMVWDRLEKQGHPEYHTHCGEPERDCPINQPVKIETGINSFPIWLALFVTVKYIALSIKFNTK